MSRVAKLTVALFSATSLLWSAAADAGAACRLDDLQSCRGCPAVAKVIDFRQPDRGEYYRDAYWNGLYAAYRYDCLALGKRLLDAGANPNLGGTSGYFAATLVQSWPHQREAVNRRWVALIRKYRFDPAWKSPYADETTGELVRNGEVTVAYPDLWRALQK